jgi:hypothetical protein
MRESLFLLLAAQGNNALVAGSELAVGEAGLGYKDFEALRPKFASSSWRGILNRLVEQRYVIKRLVGNLVVFQLSRLGEQWMLQNLLSSVLAEADQKMTLVILKPATGSRGRKPLYVQAHRLLEERGYMSVSTGVFVSQSSSYSDLLWKNLESAGFMSVFLRVSPGEVRPIQLTELLLSQDDSLALQRQMREISTEIEEVLSIALNEKELTAKVKGRIGEAVVSGLSLCARWNPLFSSGGLSQTEVLQMCEGVFRMMREYKRNNNL